MGSCSKSDGVRACLALSGRKVRTQREREGSNTRWATRVHDIIDGQKSLFHQCHPNRVITRVSCFDCSQPAPRCRGSLSRRIFPFPSWNIWTDTGMVLPALTHSLTHSFIV